MAKDKKKKKDKKGSAGKTARGLNFAMQNPLVADVVAAALVATAAAIRDSNKARRLAESVGDELTALSKRSADKGNAMWALALDVGRRAMETMSSDDAPKPRKAAKPAKSAKLAKSGTPAKASKKQTVKPRGKMAVAKRN